ncbi:MULTISPECIES: DUF488 domain-containing protein [Catenuloplanes]|uniref:Uncharacterized protein (DUF488 family) n=1 Tax=Catenuloplanes niger TaxID=587534 RepID=A0AAE3ZTB3_9ACTN|nr:DUF488 domain-containing protein [Catenuloplanes niger]MDR7323768.1 uncharacterized protein (DUF488 family) [Catenuloplanes niger]
MVLTSPPTRPTGLVGVGYEGRAIDEFVEDLVDRGVAHLVDVRLTPISRKRGFSKTALGNALTAAGIRYDHRRELGNPKANRAGFGGADEELFEARAVYAGLLQDGAAEHTLDELARAATRELVALLCFESDESRCHRHVVLRELARRISAAEASTFPAH